MHPFRSQLFAGELARRAARDSVESIGSATVDAQIDRKAVDNRYPQRGLSRPLARDAGRRIVAAADLIGIRGLLVQALVGTACDFYEHLGFDPSPLDPMTLMITLSDLRATLNDRSLGCAV